MSNGLTTPIKVPPVKIEKPAPPIVTDQPVAEISLRMLNITFGKGGTATIIARWEWLDADGAVVKQGTDRITEAELAGAGVDVASLKGLFAAVAKARAEG